MDMSPSSLLMRQHARASTVPEQSAMPWAAIRTCTAENGSFTCGTGKMPPSTCARRTQPPLNHVQLRRLRMRLPFAARISWAGRAVRVGIT